MGKWLGCLGLLVLLVLIIATLPELVFIVGGLGTVLVLGTWAYGAWDEGRVRRAFDAVHGNAGRRLILIYSQSPHWQRYIEEHWLPKYTDQAVILDWSERHTCRALAPKPPEIVLFERYGGRREYNPLAIGVPARGKVRVIRFWRAFRDFKHGREQALRRAEAELEVLAAELRDADGWTGTNPAAGGT